MREVIVEIRYDVPYDSLDCTFLPSLTIGSCIRRLDRKLESGMAEVFDHDRGGTMTERTGYKRR